MQFSVTHTYSRSARAIFDLLASAREREGGERDG